MTEKVPILLLHGALGTAQSFSSLIPILSEKYDVHYFDFGGHGNASKVINQISVENYTDQILNYLSDNQLDSVNIFGYSMGGYVAMYLAKKHPEKVISLFTHATKWAWNPETVAKEITLLDAEKIMAKVPKFAEQLAALHGENQWKELLLMVKDFLIRLGESPTFSLNDFKEINCPIILSVGDRDNTVSIEETREIQGQLPNAQLLVMPNTPHPFEKVNLSILRALLMPM